MYVYLIPGGVGLRDVGFVGVSFSSCCLAFLLVICLITICMVSGVDV